MKSIGLHLSIRAGVRSLPRVLSRARSSRFASRPWPWCSGSPSASSARSRACGAPRPAAVARRRLCRVHPQHAVPDPALFHLLCAAPLGIRLDPIQAALLAHDRSISAPMRPRSCAPASRRCRRPDRGRPRARPQAAADRALLVMFPALKAVYPALTSQFILLLLGSCVVSAISAEELTGVANTHQHADLPQLRDLSRSSTAIYVAMALRLQGDVRRPRPARLRAARVARHDAAQLRHPTKSGSCCWRRAGRVLLSLAAFVGGGSVGLSSRSCASRPAPGCASLAARLHPARAGDRRS